MAKGKNMGIYIGIGVASLAAAYFLFFKGKGKDMKKSTKKNDENKTSEGDAPTPPSPKSGERRTTPFPMGNLRGQDRTVLKKGIRGGKDVEVLQSLLNNLSIKTYLTEGGRPAPEELKIDGLFGDKTEAALEFHTGKKEITNGEIKQLIAKETLKKGIGSLFIK